MGKLEKFKEEYSHCSKLIDAVYEQLGAEDENDFFRILDDVLTPGGCGANAGFTGFVYYDETTSFYFDYRDDIKALMKSECEIFGDASILDMVSKFNGLDGYTADEIGTALFDSRRHDELKGIYDVFSKYALEEIAVFAESFNLGEEY